MRGDGCGLGWKWVEIVIDGVWTKVCQPMTPDEVHRQNLRLGLGIGLGAGIPLVVIPVLCCCWYACFVYGQDAKDRRELIKRLREQQGDAEDAKAVHPPVTVYTV